MDESANGVFWYFYFPRFLVRQTLRTHFFFRLLGVWRHLVADFLGFKPSCSSAGLERGLFLHAALAIPGHIMDEGNHWCSRASAWAPSTTCALHTCNLGHIVSNFLCQRERDQEWEEKQDKYTPGNSRGLVRKNIGCASKTRGWCWELESNPQPYNASVENPRGITLVVF